MNRSLRLSEKWFRFGLWIVALTFASFLIGLGSTIVGDLPQVEKQLSLEDFLDKDKARELRAKQKANEVAQRDNNDASEQARLRLRSAQAENQSAREAFQNWIATRIATQRGDQDPEVIERTKALDKLKAAERAAQIKLEELEKLELDLNQDSQRTAQSLRNLENTAQDALSEEMRKVELRVFLYRLALTLPLLVIAGWLFAKKRKSTYWPFVWGFIIFAAFAFFVELVPYLPSYGGYIRYIVGIIATGVIGRYAILALNRYLEKQKLAEQMPNERRREELSYDLALGRIGKGVCPGCERKLDLKDPSNDFCAHCGIGLHDHCGKCNTRKSAFAKFCHSCGTVAS